MRNAQNEDGHGKLTLDEIDRQLVAALQQEGRRSYRSLAADLSIGESVVRYRVQRMEKAGVLQIVGVADPLKVGFDLMSLVGIEVVPGQATAVSEAMSQLPEASYVAQLAGRFDLIVEVVCRDTAHFSELLQNRIQCVPGVSRTESFLVLEIQKMAYGWDVRGIGVQAAPVVTEPDAGTYGD